MSVDDYPRIFSPDLSAREYADEIERHAFHLIERVDIDRIDVDNFAMVLVQITKRRQKLKALPLLERAWLKFRAALFMNGSSSKVLRATEQLHVVLVGRRFSSRLGPMVFRPEKKCFELEVWDQENEQGAEEGVGLSASDGSRSCDTPRIVEVPPQELGAHVKQAPWEQQWWNEEEENKLMGLHAAHLRAFLTAAGVEPWEYACYHGGIAALAGLSCHVHACEFEFLRDPTCASYELTPGKDLFADWPKQWRAMTAHERRAHFAQRAEAPPQHMRALLPLSVFASRCNEDAPASATGHDGGHRSEVPEPLSLPQAPPLALYVGSPFTAIHTTFTHDVALRNRVALCCAMSGAWEGSQNLLGCCFNNAVDYDASKVVCQPNYFTNGRLLLVPTETCKMGPFTLTPEVLVAMTSPPPASLVAMVQQWTDLKRGVAQPLFDVLTVWGLSNLVEHTAIVPVDVHFGRNVHVIGTMFENLGVTLHNAALATQSSPPASPPKRAKNQDTETNPVPASFSDVSGRIGPNSVFPPGRIYATERVFSGDCAAAFTGIIEELGADSCRD